MVLSWCWSWSGLANFISCTWVWSWSCHGTTGLGICCIFWNSVKYFVAELKVTLHPFKQTPQSGCLRNMKCANRVFIFYLFSHAYN